MYLRHELNPFSGDFFKEKLQSALSKSQTCLVDLEKKKNDLYLENQNFMSQLDECINEASNQLKEVFPTGNIVISSMTSIDNTREMNFCNGLSTNFGYFTSSFCCQADEMFLFDVESSTEILTDPFSMSLDEHICFVNVSKIDEIHFPSPIYDDRQNCSILIFDEAQEQFIKQPFELDLSQCLNYPCHLKDIFTSFQNILILNGTSVVCDQSGYFAIVTDNELKFYFIIFIE